MNTALIALSLVYAVLTVVFIALFALGFAALYACFGLMLYCVASFGASDTERKRRCVQMRFTV